MHRRTDNDDLLADVMADAGEFREATLHQTLALAKRRRRRRQLRPLLAVLILLGLAVPFLKRPARLPVSAPERSYHLVQTQPLPATAVVSTHALPAADLVTSAASPNVVVFSTTSNGFEEIGDRQLLALVASHPAILANFGHGKVELIFVNPEDAKGFVVN